MNLEMQPPVFKTRQELFAEQRKRKAIFAQVSIGGRFWCWHDWTFLSPSLPDSAWDYAKGNSMLHACTKCGATKKMPYQAIEPIAV